MKITPEYSRIMSFTGGEEFIVPRYLPENYLRHCVVLADRVAMLNKLPRNSVVAEIGTDRGDFAKKIIELTRPKVLHIFDLTFERFDQDYFRELIQRGAVEIHQGDSPIELSKMKNGSLDWIYIDGDHSFDGVARDICQAKLKVRDNGYFVFNDYCTYSPLEKIQYGVQRAVNDLCLDDDFEIVFFALNTMGYHDVALRKRRSEILKSSG